MKTRSRRRRRFGAAGPLARRLKVAVLTDNMKFSGGRKVLFEYGGFLKRQGHTVDIFALDRSGILADSTNVRILPAFTQKELPEVDLLIASSLRVVEAAVQSRRGHVVHFCQGFQVDDLQQRLEKGIVPVGLRESGIWYSWRRWWKKRSWRRKVARIDRIYRLPTHLVAVSPHLQHALQQRYRKPVHLCRNGVDQNIFFPARNAPVERFSRDRPCRVVCVGSWDVTFKGIAETTRAIQIAKSRGCPVHFIRVSATPLHPAEAREGVVDEFHEALSLHEVGDLYRNCDVYISNSLEGEGFGLPAMEALSCGLSCILSDISSYRAFSETRDFCEFVPQCDPQATAHALESLMTAPASYRRNLHQRALRVASHYSLDKACARFEEILQAIAAN